MGNEQGLFRRIVDVGQGITKIETIEGEIIERRANKSSRLNKADIRVLEGALDSLQPLIRKAFKLYGVEEDAGYWTALEQDAPFPYETACAKFRSLGKDHIDAAIALWSTIDKVRINRSFGELSEIEEVSKIAQLADTIRGYFSS